MTRWVAAATLILTACGSDPPARSVPVRHDATWAQHHVDVGYAYLADASVVCGDSDPCRNLRELGRDALFLAHQDAVRWGQVGIDRDFDVLMCRVADLVGDLDPHRIMPRHDLWCAGR